MPSLINKLALQEIQQVIDQSPSILVIDPAGLKATESLDLRRELFDAGASFRVAKARLIKRALPDEITIDVKGTLALIGAEDVAAAAKIIDKLAKDKRVVIRAGLVEGKALDATEAAKLASLPSKRDLHAKVVGLLASPMIGLVRLLSAPQQNLVLVLAAHKQKLEEGGE